MSLICSLRPPAAPGACLFGNFRHDRRTPANGKPPHLDFRETTKNLAGALRRRLELGDAVLLVFTLAFVRQFFWPVTHNGAAWALTAAASLLIFGWHLRTKDEVPRPPRLFWALVAPPLLFYFLLRVALPDMSWDVLDYRLVNAERALTGWPMRPGDFFPTRFPFNPAPDMAAGVARHLLGYRMGTALNLAALLWAGVILERLLRPVVARAGLRSLSVLLLLLTEHLLFEVNNYMVDVLALPLLLEATRLALADHTDARAARRALVRVGLYLGASLAFKLTNLAFAVPVVMLCAWRVGRGELRPGRAGVAGALIALALPLLPYSLYIWWQTGNPVFPVYNWIFQSPYWPVQDPRTERWGPIVDDPRFKNMRAWEILLWPVLHPFRVENTAGDLGPHWGRVSLGYLGAIACLLWRGADRRVRRVAFVVLAGSILWSAASGMLRYAMYVETAGGLVVLYLVAALWRRGDESAGPNPSQQATPGVSAQHAALVTRALRAGGFARAAGAVLVLALMVQSASSCVFAYRYEWSVRPTFFQRPGYHLSEARNLFRDRSLRAYLSAEERALFRGVGVWVQSWALTSGVQVMTRPSVPQWCIYMDEFFSTEEGRARFARELERARGKKIYTLALSQQLDFALASIRRAGFRVGRVEQVSLPYFSRQARFHTSLLIELHPPEGTFGADAEERPGG